MASGERWEDWIGVAIACPVELPFWTEVTIFGRVYICLDRGSAIVYSGGAYWVDLLGEPIGAFGSVVDATVELPK